MYVRYFFSPAVSRHSERLLPEMRLTFEDHADLPRVLTAQRVRVLDAVRRSPAPGFETGMDGEGS